MSDNQVKPERPGGFLDFLPQDYLSRESMIRTIEHVFRSFGFDPVETPRIEFLKTLAGETSDTGKNIFHIQKTTDDEQLALPFDHTVPFARLLAANPFDSKRKTGIRLPWRRMVIGPVFRADTPQSGRYRQFYQFDADIAGTTSMMADAEIVAMMVQTMTALSVDQFIIRLNNRKILNALAEIVGIQNRGKIQQEDIIREMMRILDKLDKIGLQGTLNLLKESPKTDFDPMPNLSDDAITKIQTFLTISGNNRDKLSQCDALFKHSSTGCEGVMELRQILDYCQCMTISDPVIQIDFSIARGLDYYTGPVMEMILPDAPEFGSVFSGGRYNNLVSRFTGKELPAVGASIGIDRLFAALNHLGKLDRSKQTVTDVMILRLEKSRDLDYMAIANDIRKNGLNVEICLSEDTTFKKQFNFAISKGVHYVIICGGNEFDKQTVQVKNLVTRQQEEISRQELVHYNFKQI